MNLVSYVIYTILFVITIIREYSHKSKKENNEFIG